MASTDDDRTLDTLSQVEIPSKGGYSYSTLFWRCVTLCNSILVCALLAAVFYEVMRVQVLEDEVAADQARIAALQDEVRKKQENQIEELHQEVQQEHNFTFLTVGGIFTLLTCLISMFHMSSHLNNMKQPVIQRKVVAILWMSPIYSVTSFLSLLHPPLEGYMAIIKDFYESYCIYTFLSFLIVVLGRGSRENAVEVMAMHAHQLKNPTPFLNRWYEPPPEVSDSAKANAVLVECQIYAMQFVFIRPLTTVLYVIYRMHNEQVGEPVDATPDINNATRWLEWLPQDLRSLMASNGTQDIVYTLAPTAAPITDDFMTPPSMAPSFLEDDLTQATLNYFKSFGFALAMVVNISVFFAFTGLLKFYHSVHLDLAWCRPWPKFLTIKGVVFLTFWQGLAILIFVNIQASADDEDPSAKGHRYQNILICMEMLFFSLTHWCVFPAEEWEKDYQPPQQYNQPGIGLQDFVSDVGQIYQNRRKRRKARRRKLPGIRKSPRRDPGGVYHQPGTASMVTSTVPGDDSFNSLDEDSSSNTGELDLPDLKFDPRHRPRFTSDDSSIRGMDGDDEDDLELL